MLYLKKSLPNLKQRIKQRGRDYEKGIPDEYLTKLNRYYDEWMENYDLGKKLIIESNDLDYLKNPKDFDFVAEQILNALDQRDLFLENRSQTQTSLFT